jgi:glycosyl transferase family 2
MADRPVPPEASVIRPDTGAGVQAGHPALSVIVASVGDYPSLIQCLVSLDKQKGRELMEVIVVRRSDAEEARRITAECPGIRIIPWATPAPVPRLRSLGLRAARAAIVATTEDHFVYDEQWGTRILAAHRAHPHLAIGGAVENASRESLVDWAAYICEYGKFMLPFPAGPADDLPGPNLSYKRALLEQVCGDLLDRGVWENLLYERIRARGSTLYADPSIVAYHAKRFGFWEFLAQRYHFGRSFAATRVAGAAPTTRAFFVAIALLLPPLFLWRHAMALIPKRRALGPLLKTAPMLAVFAIAWSVGEFLGYACGDGGSSLRIR